MTFLSAFFSGPARKTAAEETTIPLRDLNIALRSRRDLLVDDPDYAGFVLGHLGLRTWMKNHTQRYLADPHLKYSPDKHFNAANPMVFYGSEGLFLSGYQGPKKSHGLAFILRDRIENLYQASPARHIVLGMHGICDEKQGVFHVHKILRATFNGKAHVDGVESLPPTPTLTREVFAALALSMEQMLSGQRLSAKENLQRGKYMDKTDISALLDRLYPSEKLDNLPPAP